MSEISFHFNCTQDSVVFHCNYKLHSIEYSNINNNVIIRLNSPSFRISFEKGKFFDMHNLLVKKGVEGENLVRPVLKDFSEIMKEGFLQLSFQNNMPVSLLTRFVEDLDKIYLDPRRYLDFEVSEILIDMNKEFQKDKPGFTTNRRITIELKSNKGCVKTIIPEEGQPSHLFSLDCSEWSEDFSRYRSIITSLHPTITEINEIVDFMKKII